ncbi:MAG: (2Fe-2S)-binding protein [Gammaproteobacteria bacterium]|nr:(2Fe-2S)-binding protein [Gammaproteobacteria bacterium]
MKVHVQTEVNGEAVEFLCDPTTTLLEVLRDNLGLRGSKEGCGTGDCGACSVELDGALACSCLILAAETQGRSVATAGLQCGVCTPGIVVAAKHLLEQDPNPTEEAVRYFLAGNLCRCTGYDKIIRAVLDAAAEMRGEAA